MTNQPQYINPEDIRNATLEELDAWFPAWREVTRTILQMGMEAVAEKEESNHVAN